ncbi:MAG: ferredoxin [Kiritimatiellia bacterium]
MATPMEKLTELRKDAVFRLFNTKFKAHTRITVGSATCENAAGANAVHQRFQELIAEKQCGDDAMLGRVGCAGRCDMEPVVTVVPFRETPVKYIHMTPKKVEEVFEKHIQGGKIVENYTMRNLLGIRNAKRVLSICGGSHCMKNHSLEVEQALLAALDQHNLRSTVVITRSACQGLCEHGPIAYVYPDGITYHRLTPAVAKRIVAEHSVKNQPPGQPLLPDFRRCALFRQAVAADTAQLRGNRPGKPGRIPGRAGL